MPSSDPIISSRSAQRSPYPTLSLWFDRLPRPDPTALAIVRSRAARTARDASLNRAASAAAAAAVAKFGPVAAPAIGGAVAPAPAETEPEHSWSKHGSGSGRVHEDMLAKGMDAGLMRGIGAWIEETWAQGVLEIENDGWPEEVVCDMPEVRKEGEEDEDEDEDFDEGYESGDEYEVAGVLLGRFGQVGMGEQDEGYEGDVDGYSDDEEGIPEWYYEDVEIAALESAKERCFGIEDEGYEGDVEGFSSDDDDRTACACWSDFLSF